MVAADKNVDSDGEKMDRNADIEIEIAHTPRHANDVDKGWAWVALFACFVSMVSRTLAKYSQHVHFRCEGLQFMPTGWTTVERMNAGTSCNTRTVSCDVLLHTCEF